MIKEIGHHTQERLQCCWYLPYHKCFLLLAYRREMTDVHNNVFLGDWLFSRLPSCLWTPREHLIVNPQYGTAPPSLLSVPCSAPSRYRFGFSTILPATMISSSHMALPSAPWSAPPSYSYDLVTVISTTSVSLSAPLSSPLGYHCQHHYYLCSCLDRMISQLHQVTPSFWRFLYTDPMLCFTHFVYYWCKIGSILHQLMQISKRQRDPC